MPLVASAASEDFIGAIQTALVAAGMLSDEIVVLDPNDETITPYDPVTDEGGVATPTKILGPRVAYTKALTAQEVFDAGLDKSLMHYSIQFLPEAGDPVIPKGMIVRVVTSKNPALLTYAFAVTGSPSGSIAALTPLQCQTNGQPAPVWVAP